MKASKHLKQQHYEIMMNGRHNKPKPEQTANGKTTKHMTMRGASERIEDALAASRLMDGRDEYWNNLIDCDDAP